MKPSRTKLDRLIDAHAQRVADVTPEGGRPRFRFAAVRAVMSAHRFTLPAEIAAVEAEVRRRARRLMKMRDGV